MPDIVVHYRFGREVFARLAEEIRAGIDETLYDHATAGPDVWFSYGFYAGKRAGDRPGRGTVMQHTKTGEFLTALVRRAGKSGAGDLLFSYLSGFLCHYCLDRAAHPYIIYRTGNYDGTEETRRYRGNHMRFEHALDLLELKKWGRTLRDRPIRREILRLRRLPRAMREDLDAVYREVFGWEDATRDLDRAVRDQRRFYFLAAEPSGLLDRILQHADNGRSAHDLRAVAYSGKDRTRADVENLRHDEWRNPFAPDLASRESFREIRERAAGDAAEMICAAWAYLRGGGPDPSEVFGDDSYEAGIPWEDPRCGASPVCEPLDLSGNLSKS